MALKMVEGWELYDGTGAPPALMIAKWSGGYNRTWNLDLTTGRNFGYGLRFGRPWTGTADYILSPTYSNHNTWIFGMNIRRGTNSMSGEFARLYYNTTQQLTFSMSGTSLLVYRGTVSGTLIATLTSVFAHATDQSWTNIQIKAVIHTSTGSITVYKEGRQIAASTNLNTDAAASGLVNNIMLTGNTNGYQSTCWVIDDFFLMDGSGSENNDLIGSPMLVEGLRPTANGYQNDGTSGSISIDCSPSLTRTWQRTTVSHGVPSYSNTISTIRGFSISGTTRAWWYTVMEFPIDIAQGSTIESANLRFTNVGNFGGSSTHFYQICYYTGTNPTMPTWDSTGGSNTWAVIDSGLGSPVTFAVPSANTTYDVDVTSVIQGAVNVSGWTSDKIFLIIATYTLPTSDRYFIHDENGGGAGYGRVLLNVKSNTSTDNWKSVKDAATQDIVKLSTVNNIESYTMGDLTSIYGNIRGVQSLAGCGKGGAGTSQVATFVRYGSTNGESSNTTLTRLYPYQAISHIHEGSPEGGTWTVPKVNAAEAGVILKS